MQNTKKGGMEENIKYRATEQAQQGNKPFTLSPFQHFGVSDATAYFKIAPPPTWFCGSQLVALLLLGFDPYFELKGE